MGSKGGVGTTTIAVNLATSLAEITADKSVALVDMNMATGETPLFLDLRSRLSLGGNFQKHRPPGSHLSYEYPQQAQFRNIFICIPGHSRL